MTAFPRPARRLAAGVALTLALSAPLAGCATVSTDATKTGAVTSLGVATTGAATKGAVTAGSVTPATPRATAGAGRDRGWDR